MEEILSIFIAIIILLSILSLNLNSFSYSDAIFLIKGLDRIERFIEAEFRCNTSEEDMALKIDEELCGRCDAIETKKICTNLWFNGGEHVVCVVQCR